MGERFELLNFITDNGLDINSLFLIMFKDYEIKRESGLLYQMEGFNPKGLIKLYYQITDETHFDGLMDKFKRNYIENENELEQVHEPCEVEGLGLVYDYIQSKINITSLNIYIILILHGILYSKAPFPEFGGKFRNKDVYLPGSGVETECWDNIPRAISALYQETDALIKEGLHLGLEKNADEIINYIDKCIELNAKLIKIHPFHDGNGRTARAFLNILFKLANVPPTYVKPSERLKYQTAMNKAINEQDYSLLKRFYYYKICDSIFELDIRYKLEQQEKTFTKNV